MGVKSAPPRRTGGVTWMAVAVAVLVTCALGALAIGGSDASREAASGPVGSRVDDRGTAKHRKERTGTNRTKRNRAGKPQRKPEPAAGQRRFHVSRVVDGDTLELGNGQTVRLVGIDTPEVGECGFEAASDALAGLVLGRHVRLTVSDEDRDQYGRLLRYVDVGTMDAGLRLIKRGLAIARYDSRDGYGYHPREDFYVGIDAATKDIGCPEPAPLVRPTGGSCAAGYTPCIPPYPPDLDCADVDGPIRVTGTDPHGLDADGDGVACEW